MRNEEEYKLELNKNTYRAIKTLSNTSIDIEKYINDCINDYKLFDSNKTYFWSNSLIKRMRIVEEKSEIARQKANIRWQNDNNYATASKNNATALPQQNNSNAIKVNKSKLNKIKLNEIKEKINKKENHDEKIHFADFVYMTNAEYEKLVSTHGKDFADQCIQILDNYKGSSGRKYKDDYRAILSWVVDKVKAKNPQKNKEMEEWLNE